MSLRSELRRRGRVRATLFALLGLWFAGCCASPAPAQDAKPSVDEFYHDFRGRPIPAELTYFNAEGGKFFKEEPEGLRITIPESFIHPWGGVGFRTSFGLQGDFEVTSTIEILHAQTPKSGFGVGVCLFVAKQPGDGAGINRLMRAGGRDILMCEQVKRGDLQSLPNTDKILRMRLKRTGTTLAYLWAPGIAGAEFEEILRGEFGDEEIDLVRFTAVTGRQPCKLDVRFIDLRIRSGQPLVGVRSAGTPPIGTPPSRRGLWLSIALAIVACVGIGLAIRQISRKTKKAAMAPGERNETAVGSYRSFACSGCGKGLKVKAELAGKMAKCPQCGQAVQVPEARSDESAAPPI